MRITFSQGFDDGLRDTESDPVSAIAKWKTTFQLIAIGFFIAHTLAPFNERSLIACFGKDFCYRRQLVAAVWS